MSSKVQDMTDDLEPTVLPPSDQQGLSSWFTESRRRAIFWSIVVVLGFVQASAHRLLVDHDGVAYMDIAANYAHGAWATAINGFYSPLYSWLTAIGLYLLHVPRSWESTILHVVNFVGYLGAYASFEFFLREVIRQDRVLSEDQEVGLSENAWHTLGLGLFLFSTLLMANLSGHSGQGDPGSTPDIFVVLFVCFAAGLLLRMQSSQAGLGMYALFGIALAFAYFAKTVMFVLALVFLAVAGFISIRRQKRVLPFLLAVASFALIAGPWVAVLSHQQGQFTYGEAGRLTYRWLVGPHANPVEWGGQTEESERLTHPPRRLSLDPPVYEFATPVAGTFPLWYGSSYWLAGWKGHFSWVGQKRIFHENYGIYREILYDQKEYVVLLLFLGLVQGSIRGYFKSLLARWVTWLPAIAALGLYGLVRVEPRYVAPFLLILWVTLFAAVKLPRGNIFQRFAYYAVVAAVLTTGAVIVRGEIPDLRSVVQRTPSEQMQVAAGLSNLGIREGQSLATIGIPRDSYYWARLAGVRVIAEIPTPNVNQYWFGEPGAQEKVRSVFAQAGAVAIVTDTLPSTVTYPDHSVPLKLPGWQRIGNTSYFLYQLESRRH
jgi:hypothetical protein